MRQLVNRNWICLGREGENGLNGDVHDHHTLSAEVERQDFEGIGDEETRETNGVEDTKDPNEYNLADTIAFRSVVRLVFAGQGSPNREGDDHSSNRKQEERASSDFVNKERGGDGDNQAEGSVAKGETKLLRL